MSAEAHIRRLMAILVAAIMLATAPVRANETEITVGVYHFPPIASVNSDGKVEGFLGGLLEVLEQIHPDVSFHIIHTSPKRRHLDFDAGLYDVIFFQSPDWGWTEKDVDITRPILADEELYVALKKPGRDSSFFNDLRNRSIVAISGYYYGFTGYETDNSVLEEKFNIEFSDSHTRNMNLIKADRPSVAEVAIISRSYLQKHFAQHPQDRDKLLISNEPDQRYQLSIIARKGGAPSADEMLRLLAPLVDDGRYRQLVENWGLRLPAGFLTSFEAP